MKCLQQTLELQFTMKLKELFKTLNLMCHLTVWEYHSMVVFIVCQG